MIDVPQLISELRDNYGESREIVPQLPKGHPHVSTWGLRDWKINPVIALPLSRGNEPPRTYVEAEVALGAKPQKASNTTWVEEVVELREAISELASRMAQLDSVLAPVRAREDQIKAAIQQTHWRRGARLCLERRGERAPYWAELLEMNVRWGRQRNERRRLNFQIKGCEREAAVLERRIAAAHKKQKGRSNA
jgi:hypothetical protein